MVLVLLGVFYFFAVDDGRRILTVAVGLLFLLAAIWFAANPFFTDGRRFVPLRQEVEHFNTLLPELHRAGLHPRDEERISRLRDQMHRAVDRMASKAGLSVEEQQAAEAAAREASAAVPVEKVPRVAKAVR
jgi:hypothetical protein